MFNSIETKDKSWPRLRNCIKLPCELSIIEKKKRVICFRLRNNKADSVTAIILMREPISIPAARSSALYRAVSCVA